MATTDLAPSNLPVVRETLASTTRQLTRMLRAVPDPTVQAVGDWTAADTAAHLATVVVLDATIAAGIDPPPHLRPVLERAATVSLGEVTELNALTLQCEPERDTAVLANRIEGHVEDLIRETSALDGSEHVRWLGGLTASTPGVLAHLVAEMLIHGRDIALASGTRFDLSADAARLFFETFLLDVLQSPELAEFGEDRASTSGPLAWEMRLRGSSPISFAVEHGRLVVGSRRAVDLHISADAAAMLLLMFNRITPAAAMSRGKVFIWGRRPWRAKRLMSLMAMP